MGYDRYLAAGSPVVLNGTVYDLQTHGAGPRLGQGAGAGSELERAIFANYIRRCCDGDLLRKPETTTLARREWSTLEDARRWAAAVGDC